MTLDGIIKSKKDPNLEFVLVKSIVNSKISCCSKSKTKKDYIQKKENILFNNENEFYMISQNKKFEISISENLDFKSDEKDLSKITHSYKGLDTRKNMANLSVKTMRSKIKILSIPNGSKVLAEAEIIEDKILIKKLEKKS